MNKKIFSIAVFHFLTISAFSQTTPSIEKALADPKRAENEAKADVYIQPKQRISDSMQTTNNVSVKKGSRKTKHCSRKPSRS